MKDMKFRIPKRDNSFRKVIGNLNLAEARQAIQVKILKVVFISNIKG